MGWWLIFVGTVMFLIGIFIKIKEYEDYSDYKDFQNLTTGKRYIKKDSDSSYQEIKDMDNVITDAEQKKERLEEINNYLDQIIQDIYSKEKKIKNSIASIDDGRNREKNTTKFKDLLEKNVESRDKNQLSEKHIKILDLAKEGFKQEEIADRLNIGIRETELILRMHRRGANND